MTHRLAAGEYAFVTGMFDAEPVFHAWHRLPDGSFTNDATDCGLGSPKRQRVRLVSMPKVHAERFARPCRNCWPNP